MKDQKPNKPKKPKKPKALATEPPTPWIMAAIVQLPYPAIAQSRAAIQWAKLKDSSSLTRASYPVFPSHRLCLAHLARLSHLGLAANQASWRAVGAPDR